LLLVCLLMAPPSQELEPPANPERFSLLSELVKTVSSIFMTASFLVNRLRSIATQTCPIGEGLPEGGYSVGCTG